MASFRLEDLSGTVEVLVWPKSFEKHRSLMKPDQPVMVRGRYEFDAKGDGRVLCSELIHLDSLWEQAVHKTRIRIALPSVSPQNLSKLHTLLNDYQGKCPLEFELLDRGRYRVRVVPQEALHVKPTPPFIQAVEKLFGEDSVALYTERESSQYGGPPAPL
jgi:DNA polymerase-3 subunit alpha